MKLHKKILTHYQSCTSPVDKEGFLYKKKQMNGSYHRRWFVLKANLLFYQERPGDRHLLGVIVLEGCAVQRADADGRFCFCLLFKGSETKSYRFAAGDEDTLESWVRTLLCASHCYLSLLLRDLHMQYQAVKHLQGSDDSPHSTINLRRPPLLYSSLSTVVIKKSPNPWHRWNTQVTPLNVPTPPSYAEWPLLGTDPREEFRKLHEYYGQEVKKAREAWLTRRQPPETNVQDLIDLSEKGITL
ncbi:sesquipedalian-1 [Corythoichthys intestinalis]|uniref:sesquipedalian-1 n=1 Tax=Corythoichthys intestinalis TaxID=161448 RepID=UPI0025A5EFEE|nr:sesquipedalian-1 [Corythoichthys intestinalis]XP_061805080.1 sesquipedalian-1-like [Nerophis lumbriciformis]